MQMKNGKQYAAYFQLLLAVSNKTKKKNKKPKNRRIVIVAQGCQLLH